MGIRVECDWCRQAIKPGEPYVTITIDGSIVRGHPSNEPKDVSGPARVYCALDHYDDDDPAASGYWGAHCHRESCASRALAALQGNPEGRADMGMEWRLVAQAAPRVEWLVDADVDVLDLSKRLLNALKRAGIARVHALAEMTEAQWIAIPGITDRSTEDIRKALHKHSGASGKTLVERETALAGGAT